MCLKHTNHVELRCHGHQKIQVESFSLTPVGQNNNIWNVVLSGDNLQSLFELSSHGL